MERWRLLEVETPNRADLNLAIEEAIFLEKIGEKGPPTVRFWRSKNAVIIGYSQSAKAEVNIRTCTDKGVQIVRRFTGGGAVYHDMGNLNYSIAIEADHPLLRGLDITESYKLFCSAITEGLRDFGITLVFDPPSDLLVRGKKVSGNAQSRRKGTIFHHGTLLVNADLDLLTEVLNLLEKATSISNVASKKRSVTNLADETGCCVDMELVKEALQRGFERVFSVSLENCTLTLGERMTAQRLCAEKYSRKEWNFLR